MIYSSRKWDDLGVVAECSAFTPRGTGEYHIMLHAAPRGELFAQQLERLCAAAERITAELDGAHCILKRYFLSDSTNQAPLIPTDDTCAVSIIQQAPLDGSKVALWMYLKTHTDSPSPYTHLWTMGLSSPEGDSARQTECVLNTYEDILQNHGATLADNCIRTWFFVRDVDTQYGGLVRARRENFSRHGLTQDTHYISSTGIGGGPVSVKSLVQMDTFSVMGLEPSQQRYLYAKSHLNPTYEYGVTFERGTLVEYGDRGHVFISGTASIDNKGDVVHVGDVVRQTRRMWENVETLLSEGGMDFSDVMQIIVYLRDVADYETVRSMFAEKFPDTPYVITLAPVCRPTWLIEMECMAVDGRTTEYRDY